MKRRRRSRRRSKKKRSFKKRSGSNYNGDIAYKFVNTGPVTVQTYGMIGQFAAVSFNWGGNGVMDDATPTTTLNSNSAFNGISLTYAYYKIVGLKIEYYPYTNVALASTAAPTILQTSRT